jgi:hypothetical protein
VFDQIVGDEGDGLFRAARSAIDVRLWRSASGADATVSSSAGMEILDALHGTAVTRAGVGGHGERVHAVAQKA